MITAYFCSHAPISELGLAAFDEEARQRAMPLGVRPGAASSSTSMTGMAGSTRATKPWANRPPPELVGGRRAFRGLERRWRACRRPSRGLRDQPRPSPRVVVRLAPMTSILRPSTTPWNAWPRRRRSPRSFMVSPEAGPDGYRSSIALRAGRTARRGHNNAYPSWVAGAVEERYRRAGSTGLTASRCGNHEQNNRVVATC